MRFPYLFGLGLMALASYLDNVRGPLFPLICRSLDLSYGHASWLFTAGNLAAIAVSFWLLAATKRHGERTLVEASLVLAASAVAASLLVTNFGGLIAFAALLGASIHAIGALSNLWTLRHSRAEELGRRLCGLHMFYGFASMLGPMAVDALLGVSPSWRWPLYLAVPVVPAMFWFVRREPRPAALSVAVTPETAVDAVPSWTDRGLLLGTICFYVAAEVFTSAWLVAFLVGTRGMTVEQASPYLAGFFLCLGLSRALCFWRLDEKREQAALFAALVAAAIASFLGHRVSPVFFAFVGLLGPFFPVFMARASHRYPTYSKQITQQLLLAMQATLAVGHWLFGRAADRFGLGTTYYAPLVGIAFVLLGVALLELRPAAGRLTALRSRV